MNRNGEDNLEMSPMDAACDDDDEYANDIIFQPTHQIIDTTSPSRTPPVNRTSASQRVRKNYLSMILLAYILTILSPGTSLWSSSSCNQSLGSNTTKTTTSVPFTNSSIDVLANGNNEYDHNDTNATPNENAFNISNTGRTLFRKCMYGSINIWIFAKLTCSTLVLIALFFNLQGSNPGLLTDDVMIRLDASESNSSATNYNTNNSDCDDEEADLERQSFLEPLPLSRTKEAALSLPLPQCKNQKLYPHTRRKYCSKCRIHPPLRSHHCNICNRCIATFDHHCLFLDTCIGERNHFRFWLFVLLNVICLNIALGIVGSAHNIIPKVNSSSLGMIGHHHSQGNLQLELRIGQAILVISKLYMYTIYSIASLLWIIHTTIALLGNSTTFEMTKGPEHIDYLKGTSMMDYPFGRGLFYNIRIFVLRDDVFRRIKGFVNGENDCLGMLGRISCCKVNKLIKSRKRDGDWWVPILWKMPECIDRESEDWWNHPWQNKYWSCC
mmetsp:Transcript_20537/g.44572  ORF Transcript_20537/g.44572 Transcript_20537/m.44572 type:complete len:497 (+) Transcript_20537:133-1623(+)